MRLSYLLPAILAFVMAGAAAVLAATLAVSTIERGSRAQILSELTGEGLGWAKVEVDGLQVRLSGTAPDEATRFRAISVAGEVVDPARVIDAMQVDPGESPGPPKFSVEILRNDSGISLIGLVPAALDRSAVVDSIAGMSARGEVTDLLETADYPVPEGWAASLDFALDALRQLPRSKISVARDAVAITAVSESMEEKRALAQRLRADAPDGITLALDISAPRPVVTPFTLRFLIDSNGARFDACTAHTEDGRARILEAARAAGLDEAARCTLGLGVPSPRWPEAAAASIRALARLGGGTVTLSDADITLVAAEGTEPGRFDLVVGELESALPEVFSLHAVLPEPPDEDGDGTATPEFVATLSPEGLLQLRGRITDERLRNAVEGFARARFGGAEVYAAMRVVDDLPDGWATRVLAALEALSLVEQGSATVRPGLVTVHGATGRQDASAAIARILSGQLGERASFEIDVTYEEELDPVAQLPTPEECVAEINAILEARQITFEPGSAEIDAEAAETIERIAGVMKDCGEVPMEIGGHTDSQGREEMNQRLSQNRAEAVLSALLARRVLTSNLTARGYGETSPIADNDTAEGREANRRIEFRLISPEEEDAAGADAAEASGATETAEADAAASDEEAAAEGEDPAPSEEEPADEQD